MPFTLLLIAVLFGLYAAWNIGANDVANAMGTSVGSRALTLRRAVICAGIFEFLGAVLVGSHVTDTIRKGIVDPLMFTSTPETLALGMLAALMASASAAVAQAVAGGEMNWSLPQGSPLSKYFCSLLAEECISSAHSLRSAISIGSSDISIAAGAIIPLSGVRALWLRRARAELLS